MEQNWRTEIDAGDYFGHQKKKLSIADRRPVIRKPSDLVGPGIAPNSVRVTNLNDLLATYDGFYSTDIGAANAPNDTDPFAGTVISDSLLGGTQTFTNLTTSETYQRVFLRSLLDPSGITWGNWTRMVSRAEADALDDRATLLEDRTTALEGTVTPLYTGLLFFFMTNVAVGDTVAGTATFPVTFSSPPAAWAIKAGFVTGSQGTLVSHVDTVTTTSCRVVLINTGPGLATFVNLPIRWFAQKASI